jgi:hypothetical protein
MRKIWLAAAALAFSSSLAFADDIMASRYGNTTIATDASGVQTKLYYKADGTFTGNRSGQSFTGTWKLDGAGNVCLNFAQTIEGLTNPTCVPISMHKVGDTWSGGGRTVSLVQGIQ